MLWRALLCCLVLAGTVYASVWEKNRGYIYNVKASSWAGFPDISEDSSGVIYQLKLQLDSLSDGLYGKIRKTQFVQTKTNAVPGQWRAQEVNPSEAQRIPELETSFKLEFHGDKVKQIYLPINTPIWVVNMVKGIASMLQYQIPENGLSTQYKTNESMVLGECAVHYTAMPMSPISELQYASLGNSKTPYIFVEKAYDFNKCRRLPLFHRNIQEPGQNVQHSLSRDQVVQAVINATSTNNNYLLVHTKGQNRLAVPPELHGTQKGMAWSNMSLWLEKTHPIVQSSQISTNWYPFGDLVWSNAFEKQQHILSRYYHKWGSGSSSSSSSSSSEEHQTVPPEPQGFNDGSSEEWSHESPKGSHWSAFAPSFPYFIATGVQGDMIEIVSNLVFQIANQLHNVSSTPQEATLSYFIQLVNGIRNLNANQMDIVYKKISQDPELRHLAVSVYEDAVAQAGTVGALGSIYRWWSQQRSSNEAAAQHISVIAESALVPDKQFMDYFWEWVINEKVQNTPHLNVSSVIAFTNLYRKVVVDKTYSHNSYPSHFIHIPTEQILPPEWYIKPIGEKMHKAIAHGDSHKALIYIRALGNIAHPKIMEYFAPYINGWKNTTEFQRWAIISSLDNIAQIFPEKTAEIFYQLYANKGERYEIRVTAIAHLIRTNASANILQKLALSTHDEPDREVISAIQSAIHTTAERKYGIHNHPRVQNAKSAVNLLRDIDLGLDFSQLMYYGNLARESSKGYDTFVGTVSSRNSWWIPKGVFVNSEMNCGGFRAEHIDVSMMISDAHEAYAEFQRYIQEFMYPEGGSQWYQRGQREREQFGGQSGHSPNAKGQAPFEFLIKYPFWGGYRVAAGNRIDQTPIPEYFNKGIKTLYYSGEAMLVHPDMLGWPTYFKAQTVNLVTGNISQKSFGARNSFVLDAAHSRHSEIQIGFFLPFINESHSAGLIKISLANISPGVKISLNLGNRANNVVIEPHHDEQHSQLLHFSMVPFITTEQSYGFIPPLKNPNTAIIHVGETHQIKGSFGKQIGMKFPYMVESDVEGGALEWWWKQARGSSFWERFNNPFNIQEELKRYRGYDILTWLSHPFSFGSIYYLNASLYWDVGNSQAKSVNATLVTGESHGQESVPDVESRNIAWPKNREPISEERQKEYIQKSSYLVGNDAGPITKFVDGYVSFGEVPLAWWIFTAARASTIMNSNISMLAYSNFKSFGLQHPKAEYEIAGYVNAGVTPVTIFNFDSAMQNTPRGFVDIQVNYINSGDAEVPNGEVKILGNCVSTIALPDQGSFYQATGSTTAIRNIEGDMTTVLPSVLSIVNPCFQLPPQYGK